MKRIVITVALLLPALYLAASPLVPTDTTFKYNNRKVVITENNDELNVSVYRQDAAGDTVQSQKIYEGIFTENRNIERRYESGFEISVPDIFKPKKNRRSSRPDWDVSNRTHWVGFGIGFTNFPKRYGSSSELTSIINSSRSLQYNLNFIEGSWRLRKSNFAGITGMGIQFNAIHLQNNKAIEVENYSSVITTTEPGEEYLRSRLHYTYLTFPLLIETNRHIGRGSHFFVNAGVIVKVKTASSSKIWWNNENGKKQKTQLPGEFNIRPVTMDFLVQGGINDFGFFASCTPYGLFKDNRGPKGYQATIGLQHYF